MPPFFLPRKRGRHTVTRRRSGSRQAGLQQPNEGAISKFLEKPINPGLLRSTLNKAMLAVSRA